MGANKSSASASMIHFTPVSQMCLQLLVRGEKQCILNQRKCALMNSVYFREVLTCNKRWFLEAWEGKWVTMEIYSDLCCVWRCGGVIFFKHVTLYCALEQSLHVWHHTVTECLCSFMILHYRNRILRYKPAKQVALSYLILISQIFWYSNC